MEIEKQVTDYSDVVRLIQAERNIKKPTTIKAVRGKALQGRMSLGGYYSNNL